MITRKVNQVVAARLMAIAATALALNLIAMGANAQAEVSTPSQSQVSATVSSALLSTPDFVEVMGTLSAFELQAGKMAQVLGQNNELRRFGRDVAQDQRTQQILNQGAAAGQVEAPPVAALPQNQADLLATLHRIDSREFDRMFIDMQVQTQQEALAIVQAYAQSGDNPALKAAAAKMVPVVQQRLGQARSMLKLVG
jgi:putative membrane protein